MLSEVSDSLNLLPFKFRHLQDLQDLRESNGLDGISMNSLPKIGYICYLGKTPVAAGFLRRVEGGFAQFDTFISDPNFGSNIRHLALSKIVNSLTQDAIDLGLEGIIAFTKDAGIFQRAKDQGFQIIEQVILTKSLK